MLSAAPTDGHCRDFAYNECNLFLFIAYSMSVHVRSIFYDNITQKVVEIIKS